MKVIRKRGVNRERVRGGKKRGVKRERVRDGKKRGFGGERVRDGKERIGRERVRERGTWRARFGVRGRVSKHTHRERERERERERVMTGPTNYGCKQVTNTTLFFSIFRFFYFQIELKIYLF